MRRLTGAAERITQTGDPSERVPEGGRGELARLGKSFNTMLGALAEAIEVQRRFVADASHELRTPLTSMQTNIDVLKQQDRLDPEARQRLFDDLQRESHEMRDLIGGLIELARGNDPRVERTSVQLDELVESSVERARVALPAADVRDVARADDRRRRPRAARASRLEPARERRQVERVRRDGRGDARGR